MHTKIKICGLTRPEDIDTLNALKPDYIGFVFAPSRRQVTLEQACALQKSLVAGIIPVGVFVDAPIDEILAAVECGAISAVQLHGSEDEAFIEALRRKIPSQVSIIKAVSVHRTGDAQAWENSAADFLLLDHKTGGTGEAFDWSLIGHVKKPFFLAGGLTPENVARAVQAINPCAVDVSSGVEASPGVKCPKKIMYFIQTLK